MSISNFINKPDGDDDNNSQPSQQYIMSQMAVQQGQTPTTDGDNSAVLELLINYNERFKNEDPILFRDLSINQTIGALIGKSKPNALLIGMPGVGKTKIVEDLARRIENNDIFVPSQLKDKIIYELPLTNLVAGTGIRGQLEEKVKAIISFAEDPANNAILFIDEIHTLIESNSEVYKEISQMLKPALARGDMRVIGATTNQEATHLGKDPAFNRRFSRVIIDELSKEQTIEVLHIAKNSYTKHYGNRVIIPDNLIEILVDKADLYAKPGHHRPDTALTLMDRSMADSIMRHIALEEAAKDDTVMLQALQSIKHLMLSENQITTTAKKMMSGTNRPEKLDLDLIKEALSEIKGQDHIIDDVFELIQKQDKALYPQAIPKTLMFTGPTGVGKTEIVRIIAGQLTGKEPIILNMTEFHSSASINRIIGSPAGYVGSDSNAELPFDILETNPHQVILLDEFEKCDKAVQRLFMSVFDSGEMRMSSGKLINFSKCIIVATTNAGHSDTRETAIGFAKATKPTKSSTVNELAKSFDKELINRFTQVLTFSPISKETFASILENKYKSDIEMLKANGHVLTIADTLSKDIVDELVEEHYVKELGARPIRTIVQTYIENNA